MNQTVPQPEPKSGLAVVRALERGMALLRAFSQSQPRLSLAALSRRTGLDKSTTRRLLNTLMLGGLVEIDAHSGEYYLSAGVLELASAVETGREFRTVAAPWLVDVAEQTGATAFLWVLHHGSALCVDRACAPVSAVSGNWSNVGTRLALNLGAGPRVLLAWMDAGPREALLTEPLEARTPQSQTDPRALLAELETIRASGYALASDDFVPGLSALGVPVFNARGDLVGALSITTLSHQIMREGKPLHADLLERVAQEISRHLV